MIREKREMHEKILYPDEYYEVQSAFLKYIKKWDTDFWKVLFKSV